MGLDNVNCFSCVDIKYPKRLSPVSTGSRRTVGFNLDCVPVPIEKGTTKLAIIKAGRPIVGQRKMSMAPQKQHIMLNMIAKTLSEG